MICGVYGILHRPSGRWYIGISTDILRRWNDHLTTLKKGTCRYYLYNALRSYPPQEFLWITLEVCGSEDLHRNEILWVSKLRAYGDGFNSTPGGDWNPVDLPEVRAKISAANSGSGNHTYGKPLPEATRKKISATLTGRKLSTEMRARIGAGLLGRHHSTESRQKMAEVRRAYWVRKRSGSLGDPLPLSPHA